MDAEQQFSQIASLIGEPARAKILWNLLDGRAFTATELSLVADVSPQSASMHLSRLTEANLLAVERQGRHRYYKFANAEVAAAVEAIANLLPPGKPTRPDTIPGNGHIQYCRSCYDHLAGKIGVAITDRLLHNKLIAMARSGAGGAAGDEYEVTTAGRKWFAGLGIGIEELQARRRVFSRPCLDWSERRHHMAGSLGAALLEKMLQEDWIRTTRNSRALLVTGKGEKKLQESLGLRI